jgi:hypothetical protein
MPVFYYLSEEEAADVYLYLTLYPPSEQATSAPLMAASEEEQRPSGKGPARQNPRSYWTAGHGEIRNQPEALISKWLLCHGRRHW